MDVADQAAQDWSWRFRWLKPASHKEYYEFVDVALGGMDRLHLQAGFS